MAAAKRSRPAAASSCSRAPRRRASGPPRSRRAPSAASSRPSQASRRASARPARAPSSSTRSVRSRSRRAGSPSRRSSAVSRSRACPARRASAARRPASARASAPPTSAWSGTTGTVDAAIARATTSSLNAQRSSREPPPRPTITTSTSASRFRSSMPAAISRAAPRPCTRTGRITTAAAAQRRPSTVRMSWIAAPWSAVTIPTARGQRGSGRLRASAKSPSAPSLAFSCSKASVSAPRPRGSIAST